MFILASTKPRLAQFDLRLPCSNYADINARGSLELFSYGISIALSKYLHAYIYSVDSGKLGYMKMYKMKERPFLFKFKC